jgi:hypothetical protein
MTFFIALAVLFLAATTLLVFAGREALRIKGVPPRQVSDLGDVVHLVSHGYSHLNEAAARAVSHRMSGQF